MTLPMVIAHSPDQKLSIRLELDKEGGSREYGDWLPSRISVMILNSDEKKYGGQGAINTDQYLQRSIRKRIYGLHKCRIYGLQNFIQLPLHSRTTQAYK
ncbi:1,4-alpha-glucan-branching enzyme 3, chloroplastic/amyloplastic-like [Silene latifolia]|uniref:1,4-alpha-glucan-branching enzyme 3, chloroplastic/amyloplastic-like n=1 Tax=Silene latifolia TaxID=37657 RepID=UPI003D77CE62